MNQKRNETMYWTVLEHEGWLLHIAATQNGLCFVGSQDKTFDELAEWAKARYPHAELQKDDDEMKPYANELREYMAGERKEFSIPFDFRGTPFQTAVWQALVQIPYGETKTYAAIAQQIEKPAAVRAVGAAIGANPILISIPCHRVIGKDGSLTGYRGGLDMKKKLLALEKAGVEGGAAYA
ncbi:methylated-DNA--[protein]-cysteine S-methyltransferase [Brevibacillus fluminis]|uniref:Methylated-DNA--protein-cysteine methyltransferase n=1 Tax=Brevibacillus fluminis TaxID=511487 RepID=A0A3M8DZD5_9BACL|nr:methylated-DNA--[protein]-cysteine S-methyltransferase [Brevibacillus fluminis]RNB92347.1 methylated-DNA--[protein]-cysteine S-methyltransferase [Brevibacillus fluminis]